MLQFYDIKSVVMGSAIALAFAVVATPAHGAAASSQPAAGDACMLEDGFASAPGAFADEVAACAAAGQSSETVSYAAEVAALSERHRAKFNLPALGARTSLTVAAEAHALDLAARGYAGHASPEGLTHLDRLRRLDRSALFSATGGNIVILAPGTSAVDAFAALISDPVNAENLRRDAFTDSGVGVAKASDGRVIVVQVFARMDGELEAPLPLRIVETASASISELEPGFHSHQLALRPVGARVAAPISRQIVPSRHARGEAGLELEAQLGTALFSLYGPVVTIG
ncbi:MAG: CAP domain-containing protein [Pseudomonadota bacterium]